MLLAHFRSLFRAHYLLYYMYVVCIPLLLDISFYLSPLTTCPSISRPLLYHIPHSLPMPLPLAHHPVFRVLLTTASSGIKSSPLLMLTNPSFPQTQTA